MDGAAQDRLHPRDELLGPERLGDVVVRAELQAAQDVRLVLAGGEQEHRDVLVDVSDPLEDHEAGELREVDIEDHQIGVLAGQRVEGGLAVVRPHHLVALAP